MKSHKKQKKTKIKNNVLLYKHHKITGILKTGLQMVRTKFGEYFIINNKKVMKIKHNKYILIQNVNI